MKEPKWHKPGEPWDEETIERHRKLWGTRAVSLTFDQLRRANRERRDEIMRIANPHFRPEDDGWSLNDWMVALTGEVGEAANLLKKVRRGNATLAEVREELAKELADVQIYLDLLADAASIDLGEATVAKWNEVSERAGLPHRLVPGGRA